MIISLQSFTIPLYNMWRNYVFEGLSGDLPHTFFKGDKPCSVWWMFSDTIYVLHESKIDKQLGVIVWSFLESLPLWYCLDDSVLDLIYNLFHICIRLRFWSWLDDDLPEILNMTVIDFKKTWGVSMLTYVKSVYWWSGYSRRDYVLGCSRGWRHKTHLVEVVNSKFWH